jgi:hypothetical protein
LTSDKDVGDPCARNVAKWLVKCDSEMIKKSTTFLVLATFLLSTIVALDMIACARAQENQPPTADFNIVSSPKPTVDEDITFLDQSSDPDGNIKLWFWDFGDGTSSTAQSVTHRYFALGTFIVNLTVTDDGGKTGAISKSLTIYDVLPPVTVDDYDGWGHTSDFTINLNATDDLSRVQTIYYIINGGSTMNVQAQGQPRISVEGHNKLEYWSVDFCGNEETHHVIQDIHLDKTSRPRAILVVAGITLAIGISAAGTILYARAKKEKEKNQTLRRS